jgi:hypothetical protein
VLGEIIKICLGFGRASTIWKIRSNSSIEKSNTKIDEGGMPWILD